MNPVTNWGGLLIVVTLFLVQLSSARNVLTFDLERKSSQPKEKYAIVLFETSSSATRVRVYKRILHKTLRVSDVHEIRVPKPDRVFPGLNEFAGNIDGLRGYLKPLIDGAMKVVPKENQASTTIRLFATTLLRSLKQEEVDAILTKVDDLLLDKEFCPFKYEHGFSKVISGREEAVYLWVTVNFLKGLFSGKSSDKSYGALDIGSSSTQIAFEVESGTPSSHLSTLDLMGRKYRVYAHTYHRYGVERAGKFYLEKLTRMFIMTKEFRSNGQNIIYSPCHNYGFNTSVTVDGKNFTVRGLYENPEHCQRLIKLFFFCKSCTVKNSLPRLSGELTVYTTSLFKFAYRVKGVVQKHDRIVTMSKIKKTADSYCLKSVFELNARYDCFAYPRCLYLNYMKVMLVDGFKIDEDDFVLHNAGKMNGYDLTWSLGAVLLSNNFLE